MEATKVSFFQTDRELNGERERERETLPCAVPPAVRPLLEAGVNVYTDGRSAACWEP